MGIQKLSQLLILGGQRDKEILRFIDVIRLMTFHALCIINYSDMLTYDVRSGEISILADGRDQTSVCA